MSKKKYIVRISSEEREALKRLVNQGKSAAYKRRHAQILLKADVSENGANWTDLQISKAFDVSSRTVERIRQRLVENGLDAALSRAKQKRRRKPLLDGEQEAYLVALACQDPPTGFARWNLRILADKMVELDYVDSLSRETVRQVLKKHHQALAEERVVYSA